MILGHTLAESKKAVIAAIIFLASIIALFVAYDPGIKTALIVLVGNGFAVVAVFAAPRFSAEDLSKTLGQLSGSVFTLLAFFIKVNPSLPVTIASIIGLIPIGYAIWRARNLEPITLEASPPLVPPLPMTVAAPVE